MDSRRHGNRCPRLMTAKQGATLFLLITITVSTLSFVKVLRSSLYQDPLATGSRLREITTASRVLLSDSGIRKVQQTIGDRKLSGLQCNLRVAWFPNCQNGTSVPASDPRCLHYRIQRPVYLLPKKVVEKIKTFIFFIGHARSGSSITGSLLDGHPNIILSNELFIFHKMVMYPSFFATKEAIANALALRARTMARHFKTSTRKGYSLYINGSRMGTYTDHVEVIGDKGAGSTVGLYMADPEKFGQLFKTLRSRMNTAVKVIQIVRNPYDVITTDYIYEMGGVELKLKLRSTNSTFSQPFNRAIDCSIRNHFSHYEAIHSMSETLGLDLYRLHLSALIASPSEEVQKLCSFLDLHCSEDYLRMCADAVYKNSSRSRYEVEWTQEQISTVQLLTQQFTYLHRYSFDSD